MSRCSNIFPLNWEFLCHKKEDVLFFSHVALDFWKKELTLYSVRLQSISQIASWRIIVELLDYTIRILILDDASYSSLVVIRDMRFHSRIRNRVAL
ncbi:hypothetical protein RIR_jg6260.t1 [Rhizophagus irregularis DAOM 181602=DAOM 197198]|nr:hypothetical protein RIR_jg6260.t1 [Rhizophagus irregularis DAOM 181602=DAOM 197198]